MINRAFAAYLLGMLFFLYAFIQRVAPSVMTSELMLDLAVGATSLGVLSSAYFYAYAALQLPIGLLTDRFGPRRLMSLAALACGLASLGFALSDTLLSASLFRALVGAGVAFSFVGTLAILVAWFPAHRFALLAGILQSMGMVGALAGQTPLRWFIESSGWRNVFICLAVVAVLLAVALWFVVPRRQVAAGDELDVAADVASEVVTARSPNQKSFLQSLKQVTLNSQSWVCALLGFGMAAPMLAFAGLWAIPWLVNTRGWSDAESATVVAWLFVGWALSAPMAGWMSDRIGRRKPVLMAGALLSLLAMALLVYIPVWSKWQLAFLFFIAGCGGSAMIVLFGSVRELNRPANNAAAMGFCNMFVVGSGGVMQFLLGWMLDLSAGSATDDSLSVGLKSAGIESYAATDFQYAFNALVATCALSVLVAALVRETHCKQQVH